MLNPAAPFRVALRLRDPWLLLTGLAVSEAGDWLYNLALLALVYDRTGSSTWLGIATAARMLPLVALGPLGGVLADRLDRRGLMIGSDLLRRAAAARLGARGVRRQRRDIPCRGRSRRRAAARGLAPSERRTGPAARTRCRWSAPRSWPAPRMGR